MSNDIPATEGKRVGLPRYVDHKHPKTGPRQLQAGDTENYESGYDRIWAKSKISPPSCPLCNNTESNPECPIC